jgi:hypothetical protein
MRPFIRAAIITLFVCASAWAAQQPTPVEVTILSESTYSEGTYEIPSVAIPSGYTVGSIKLDRTAWLNPAATVEWHLHLSMDGGKTWEEPHVAGGARGGIVMNPRTGLPATYSSISVALPEPGNHNRRFKGTVVVSGGTVTTTVYGGLR